MKDVAVINAVKSGKFECTILASARGSDIQGAYCLIPIDNISAPQDVLCRIGYIDVINPIHENISFQPIIMVRGSVPHFSGDADIEKTQLEQVSVIDRATGDRVSRRANPPTGTRIRLLNSGELTKFENEKLHRMIVGVAPHDDSLPISIINRHYGMAVDKSGKDVGGWGEAHHEAYFGQNGSGKTVEVLKRVAGRLVAHKQVGFFCPDTAGDISQRGRHHRGEFRFDFYDLMERGGCKVDVIDIADIALGNRDTWEECLSELFSSQLNKMKSENASTLARRVADDLLQDGVHPGSIDAPILIDSVIDNISACYSTKSIREEKEAIAKDVRDNHGARRRFEKYYESDVRRLFAGKYPLKKLIYNFLRNGSRIVLKMHTGISSKQQNIVMREIFSLMRKSAEDSFRTGGTVNAMVLLDEGPRWIAQGDKSEIAEHIKDAFHTTRKYGLGWTIISQRLAAIDKGVIAQCHTKWFGRGLKNETDMGHMVNEIGKAGLQAYEKLGDHDYFWIGVGQDANIGSGSTYFSVRPFDGDVTEAIIKANPHIWREDVLL